MSYKIDNLSKERLQELNIVLSDIYTKFIVTENFDNLEYEISEGLHTVSSEKQNC